MQKSMISKFSVLFVISIFATFSITMILGCSNSSMSNENLSMTYDGKTFEFSDNSNLSNTFSLTEVDLGDGSVEYDSYNTEDGLFVMARVGGGQHVCKLNGDNINWIGCTNYIVNKEFSLKLADISISNKDDVSGLSDRFNIESTNEGSGFKISIDNDDKKLYVYFDFNTQDLESFKYVIE